jgi:hypothetical protein
VQLLHVAEIQVEVEHFVDENLNSKKPIHFTLPASEPPA